MSEERQYFVLCEDNCRFPAMTKEEVIAAIAEATGATPTHIDDAFITKLKEQNANKAVKIWLGTNFEYNALETIDESCLYIITDESYEEDVQAEIEELNARINEFATDVTTLNSDVTELKDKVNVTLLAQGTTSGTNYSESINLNRNIEDFTQIIVIFTNNGTDDLQIGLGGVTRMVSSSSGKGCAIFNYVAIENVGICVHAYTEDNFSENYSNTVSLFSYNDFVKCSYSVYGMR